jgi:hypothetical protein
MKLGETKDFWVVRQPIAAEPNATEKFYSDAVSTTDDILKARLCADRDERDTFKDEIGRAAISSQRKLPATETFQVRITTGRV